MVLAVAAYALLAFASLIAAMNFYLSFVRYPLYRWAGGDHASYRFVSGCPGMGTLACIAAAWLIYQSAGRISLGAGAWIVILQVIDTGGFAWFFAVMAWMTLVSCLGLRRPDEP